MAEPEAKASSQFATVAEAVCVGGFLPINLLYTSGGIAESAVKTRQSVNATTWSSIIFQRSILGLVGLVLKEKVDGGHGDGRRFGLLGDNTGW